MTCKRPGCDAETREQICSLCLRDVEKQLGELPALVDELEATALRQSRGTSNGRRGNGERPLPFSISTAVLAARRDVDAVIEWASLLANGRPVGSTLPGRVLWAAGWLLSDLGWFRIDEQAGQCAEAVATTTRSILRAIDRPPARIHAGPCGEPIEVVAMEKCQGCCESCGATGRTMDESTGGLCWDCRATGHAYPCEDVLIPTIRVVPCEAPLIGKLGDDAFTCRACGAEHTAADRKAFQLEALRTAHLPLGEILPALPKLVGVELDRGTVRVWKHRGKIAPVVTTHGVELYRGGDILALIEAGNFPRVAAESHG